MIRLLLSGRFLRRRQFAAGMDRKSQFGGTVMSRFSSRRLIAGSLVVAMFSLVALLAANRATAKDGGLVGVEGTLVAVDPTAGTLTIRTRRMQDVAITVNAATKI